MDTLSSTFYPLCFCCSRAAVGERLPGRRTSRQSLPSNQVRRASQGCQDDPGIAPNGVSRAQLLVFEDLECSFACSWPQPFAGSSPPVVPSGSLFVVAWLVLVAAVAVAAVAAGCWHSGLVVVVVLAWVAAAVAADWAVAVSAVEVVELAWIGTAAAEYLVLENATVAFAAQPVSVVEPELASRRLVDVPSFAAVVAVAGLGYCVVAVAAVAAAAAVVVVAAAAVAAAVAAVVAAVAVAAAVVVAVVAVAAAAAVVVAVAAAADGAVASSESAAA